MAQGVNKGPLGGGMQIWYLVGVLSKEPKEEWATAAPSSAALQAVKAAFQEIMASAEKGLACDTTPFAQTEAPATSAHPYGGDAPWAPTNSVLTSLLELRSPCRSDRKTSGLVEDTRIGRGREHWSRQTMEYLRHPSAQGEVYLLGGAVALAAVALTRCSTSSCVRLVWTLAKICLRAWKLGERLGQGCIVEMWREGSPRSASRPNSWPAIFRSGMASSYKT
eukprot:g20893.t1